MSTWVLIWRNILHRKAMSLLAVCSAAITVALIAVLIMSSESIEQGAEKGYGPFELTIGADGSESQLVLNTFYHIGAPTGNVPLETYEAVKANAQTKAAFAMTTGDQYNGYPIVGIDPGYFPVRYGDRTLHAGKLYAKSGEVTVGWHVAQTLGLKIGDTFKGSHGLVEGAADHDHEAEEEHEAEGHHEEHDAHESFVYTIVGILPPLYTSDDRAVFTTMDYAWHVHESQQADHKEVTAILVQPKSLLGAQTIKQEFDKLENVQAAYTSKAVADVVNLVDRGSELIRVLTAVCALLATATIVLSLVAAVHEREKDMGLLRLIGKTKRFIWSTVIGEGLLLISIGLIAGLILGHTGCVLAKDYIFDLTGLQVIGTRFYADEWLLVLGTLLIGLAATVIPSLRVYRVNPIRLFQS